MRTKEHGAEHRNMRQQHASQHTPAARNATYASHTRQYKATSATRAPPAPHNARAWCSLTMCLSLHLTRAFWALGCSCRCTWPAQTKGQMTRASRSPKKTKTLCRVWYSTSSPLSLSLVPCMVYLISPLSLSSSLSISRACTLCVHQSRALRLLRLPRARGRALLRGSC